MNYSCTNNTYWKMVCRFFYTAFTVEEGGVSRGHDVNREPFPDGFNFHPIPKLEVHH